MGVKLAVLPNVQPPTVAFAVLAKLCGPKANETETGTALFTKMNLTLNLTDGLPISLNMKEIVQLLQ